MTDAMTDVVLELGPGVVRRLWPDLATAHDQEAVSAALGGIDDTIVLVDGRPTDVTSLWQRIVASIWVPDCRSLTIVYPTWWPKRRVDRFVGAVALTRSHVLAGDDAGRSAVVIEIGDDVIAISTRVGSMTVLDRASAVEQVVEAAMKAGDPRARFVVDAPTGVPGAEVYATSVREALSGRGLSVVTASIEEAVACRARAAVREAATAVVKDSRHRVVPRAVTAVMLAAVVCGVVVGIAHPHSVRQVATDKGTNLVEGRVVVRIPLHWNVEKVTAGPGSRRVRVRSPADSDLALHITQSYTPGETLRQTAEALERAMATEPADVFRDFSGAGERAGRPAVTYREARAGRVIGWSVLVAGSMRIGIGCQSPSGREGDIQDVCDAAVRSASELNGTDPGR